jgi:branched-subunit amino acid aminotransferase/4-amino-4-deoxychorismate lyase
VVIPRGSEELRVVPRSVPRIPSVTEAVIRDIAEQRGVPIVEAPLALAGLEGSDLWVVSALHGIRIATDFPGGPALSPESARRGEWQELWWKTRQPLG